MKFKKKLPVSYDLEKEFATLGDELKRLIGDSENIKTYTEISDWLVRLYTAAGKLVVAQEICRSPQLKPETAAVAKQIVDEFVPNMLSLHKMAEDALAKMLEMSAFVPEVEGQEKAFASLHARSVYEFFRDKQHRKEFEEWYLKEYGKPYVWESVSLIP